MTQFLHILKQPLSIGSILALLVLLVAFTGNSEEVVEGQHVPESRTYELVHASSTNSLQVSGNLDSENIAVLSSQAHGAVTHVYATVGETVSEGAIIAVIDHTELSASLGRLEALHDQAVANLAAARVAEGAGVTQAQLGYQLAQVSETTGGARGVQQAEDMTQTALSSGYSTVMNLVSAVGLLAELENKYRWDIEKTHNSSITFAFTDATGVLLGRDDTSWWEPQYLTELYGGVRGEYESLLSRDYSTEEVVVVLDKTYEAALLVQKAQDLFKPVFYQVTDSSAPGRVSFAQISEIVQGALVSIPEQKRQLQGVDIAETQILEAGALSTQQAGEQLKATHEGLALQVEIAESGVAVIEAQIREVETQIANAYIRAPFTGIVSEKYVTKGVFVGVGQPVAQLVQQSGWKIRTSMSEVYNESLAVGTPVRVEIDGVSGEYAGVITAISPSVDPVSRKIAIEIAVANLPDSAKAGLLARVTVPVSVSEGSFHIPREFLRYDYRGAYVTEESGVVHRVNIQVEGDTHVVAVGDTLASGIVIGTK